MAKQTSEQDIHRRAWQSTRNKEDVVSKKPMDEDDRNWFSFMVSYPLKKHMSKVELFTQWSALLVYFPVATLSLYVPNLLATPFNIQTGLYGSGLASLSGLNLGVIAFCYCIFSRAQPQIPSMCIILATTFERIGIIGACSYIIYRQDLLPASFILAVAGADFGLSVIGIYIWSSSTEASVRNYFGYITQVMSFRSPKLNYSSSAVQFLGLLQLVAACIFLAFPNTANHTLQLNDIQGHQRGLVSVAFMGSAAIGFVSLCCGGADSKACNIAAVFYRLAFTIPYVIVANVLQQIPFGLAGYSLCTDVTSVVVILITLYMDKKLVK